jgi:hypothetical protein
MIPGNNFDNCSTPIFACKVKHRNVLQILYFFAHDTCWESKKKEDKKRSAFQRMECLLMGAFCFFGSAHTPKTLEETFTR